MQVSVAGFFERARLIRPQHVILALLSAILIGLAAESAGWRINGDLAWELYVSHLVDQHGFTPYRDIFVIDQPGTIATYIVIGRLIGYTGDIAARLLDAACFAALAGLTWLWLRDFGKTAVWGVVALFGLAYLDAGSAMALQREYLLLPPMVCAAWLAGLAGQAPKLDDRVRAGVIGALFGLVATVKPNAAIGLAAVAAFMLVEIRARDGGLARRGGITLLAITAAGAALPLLVMAAILAISGALGPYLELLTRYGPLYGQTSYNLTVIAPGDRLDYLYATLVTLNGRQAWLIAAAVGVMFVYLPGAGDARLKRKVGLMLGLAGCYLVYPALTGQFFAYHWLPFDYFLIALVGLCLAPVGAPQNAWLRAAPLLAALLALGLRYGMIRREMTTLQNRFVAGRASPAPENGRPDQIAAYARAYFAPGDSAQLLDWGNGAMLGMLLADVPPANRFVFDTPFFYDAQGAYTQGLRRELIDQLSGPDAPAWIVYVAGQQRLQGPGVDYAWPELQQAIDAQYQPSYYTNETVIYRRSDGVPRGVIVFPAPGARGPDSFITFPKDQLMWVTAAQTENAETLDKKLAAFSGQNDIVWLDFAPLDADPLPLLSWLSQNAYHLGDQQIEAATAAEYVSRADCAGAQVPADATFGEAITLDTAAVARTTIGDETFLCAELHWQASQPIGQMYHVALHVIGPDGQLVAQHDGIPMAGIAPTNTWTPGQTVIDRFAVRLPRGLAAGRYTMNVVVYDPGTGQRLVVSAGDSVTISILALDGP